MSFLDHYKSSTRPKIENGITKYSNAVKRNISATAIRHNWTGTWSGSITVFHESKDTTIIAPSISHLKGHPLAPNKDNGGDYTRYIISRTRTRLNGYRISPQGMKLGPLEVARSTGEIKDYI